MGKLDSDDLPEWLDVDVFKLRKCPNCGGKNYHRSLVKCTVTEFKKGRMRRYNRDLDAGSSWACLDCGIDIAQDGSWEINKRI